MKFPVLVIGNAFGIDFCNDFATLTTSNARTLKSGILLQNHIIDCEGDLYLPVTVAKEKTLRFSLFLNPLLKIRYEFTTSPRKLLLAELREDLVKRVKAQRAFYTENGDVQKLISLIEAANSFQSLIILFDWDNSAWRLR